MNFNIRQKKVIEAKDSKIVCLAGAGSGKCIPNSTKIPTPEGWKRVDEIKVGDYLFDRQGKPTKVLGVYPQGEKEVYEISFGDNRKAKCSIDHIWSVHKNTWKDKNSFKEYTLQEILNDKWERIDSRGHKSHNFSIPCCEAIEYNLYNPEVNPYVFGTFLGDGCCKEKALTISSNDEEIVKKIQKIIDSPRVYRNKANYHWTFYCNETDNKHIQTKDIFNKYSDAICCYSYEKYIPNDFKYTTIENRYSLIQGLMDTDGSISYRNGRYHTTFSTTSPRLRDDFIEVMGSLGYVCTYYIDKRAEKYTNKEAYEIHINIPNSEKYKLFSLSRKKTIAEEAKNKKQNRAYDRTTIINIKDLGFKEEMTCFYVDNEEHLFLMNDFLVTHNTKVLTERIRQLLETGCPPEQIVAISFTNMAADEMKKRLGEIAEGVFIGTVHSYANNVCIAAGIPTDIYVTEADFNKIIEKALTVPTSRYFKVKYLLIDEFQDTTALQFKFFEKINAENVFVVGDERQAIYGFNGASPEYLYNCAEDINFKTYYLNQNYRCAPNILSFADDLIATMPKISLKSEAVKQKEGTVTQCCFSEALEELEWTKDYRNWAILCRTNNELATAMSILEKNEIPYLSFKKGDLELMEMESLLKEDKVKLLTVHSAKGLQFKKVIVTGARMFKEEERRIAYVAATRAEQALYWCPSICGRGKKNRPANRDMADAGKMMEKFAKNNIVF